MPNYAHHKKPDTCSTCRRWSRYGRQWEGYCIKQQRPTKYNNTCGNYAPERRGKAPYYNNDDI